MTKADVEKLQVTLEMIYSDETADPLTVRRALMSNSADLNFSNGAYLGALKLRSALTNPPGTLTGVSENSGSH